MGIKVTAKLWALEVDARSLLLSKLWLCRHEHCNWLYGIAGGLAWCKFALPGVSAECVASSMGLVVPVAV